MYETTATFWTGVLDITFPQRMRDNTIGVSGQTEERLRNTANRTNAHCGVILHIGRTPVLSFRSAWCVLKYANSRRPTRGICACVSVVIAHRFPMQRDAYPWTPLPSQLAPLIRPTPMGQGNGRPKPIRETQHGRLIHGAADTLNPCEFPSQ